MNTHLQQEFARAHLAARLGEAQSLRRGRNVVAARRLSRRAARAEQLARLAAARV
jgi:hypothetical protein